MYELIQVSGGSYYVQSPAKAGLVRLNDTDVCLIDSGSDKDAGRKIRQILDKNGWHLTAICNTHSHADHIGGNRYLQSQTGCRVYAPGAECAVTRHPVLEPSMLYGGCPPRELRNKFLMAQDSDAAYLTAEVLPQGMELLPLAGHCMEMVAAMTARAFVPAHAEVTEDIAPLARYNMDAVLEVGERITALCAQPVTFEELLKGLFDHYGMAMSFQQYALIGSTLRSYLTWLQETGRVAVEFADNRMLWRRV